LQPGFNPINAWRHIAKRSRSTYGYLFQYGGSPLLWKSKKHKAISFSTTNAEYIAATELTREISWVENLFLDLKLELVKPIELFGNNKNTNGIGNGTTINNRTRPLHYESGTSRRRPILEI